MHRMLLLFCLFGVAGPAVGSEDPKPAPNPEIAKQAEKLVGAMGSDEYQAREDAVAKLLALGDPALPALERAAKEASDPAVRTRAQDLVHRLKLFRAPEQLTKEERAVAELAFELEYKEGAVAPYKLSTKDDYGIIEVGDVRLAVANFKLPDLSEQVAVDPSPDMGAGQTRGSAQLTLHISTRMGQTTMLVNDLKLKFAKAILTIDGESLALGKGPRVVFLNEDGKVQKIVEVPKKK